MSLFYVERRPWQHWPKVLVMVRKGGDGDERRRYVPERTCENVGARFTCSECGAHIYGGTYEHSYADSKGVRWYTSANPPKWNYCPNCGAKVVSE